MPIVENYGNSMATLCPLGAPIPKAGNILKQSRLSKPVVTQNLDDKLFGDAGNVVLKTCSCLLLCVVQSLSAFRAILMTPKVEVGITGYMWGRVFIWFKNCSK
jgi:hypothetical protein